MDYHGISFPEQHPEVRPVSSHSQLLRARCGFVSEERKAGLVCLVIIIDRYNRRSRLGFKITGGFRIFFLRRITELLLPPKNRIPISFNMSPSPQELMNIIRIRENEKEIRDGFDDAPDAFAEENEVDKLMAATSSA